MRICPKCKGEYSHISKEVNGHKAYVCEDCGYVFWESEASTEVPLELSDGEFAVLARMAHERDVTFNQLINDILRAKLDDFEAFVNKLRDEFGLPKVLSALSSKDLQDYIRFLEAKHYGKTHEK